jgi:UDP-glucose 4-epimerase
MARWLITGGCGFIGLNLIRRLLTTNDALIRVVDNLTVGNSDELARLHPLKALTREDLVRPATARLELLVGDVLDEDLIRGATRGSDIFVHLAANTGVSLSVADPRKDCLNNVLGTLNCLEACRYQRTNRFIFASSGASIGECQPPLHEELPAHPVSPYGASKLAGEAYCSAFKASFGVDAVALRFSNCYGPRSSHKDSVVAKFISEAMSGRSWHIFGDGTQSRDFIYVDDVVAAIILAASHQNVGGETFQIATNNETTIITLTENLAKSLKHHQITIPEIVCAPARTGDIKRNFSDTKKAQARLGWKPRILLPEGLNRTVEWFVSEDSALYKE